MKMTLALVAVLFSFQVMGHGPQSHKRTVPGTPGARPSTHYGKPWNWYQIQAKEAQRGIASDAKDVYKTKPKKTKTTKVHNDPFFND